MLALHTACLDSIPETSVPTYLSLLKVRWWKLELPPCKGCWVQNGVAAALCFCETRTGAWICCPGSFLSFSPDSSFLLLLNSGEHPSLLNCLLCKILEGLFLRHCMYEMSLLNHVPRSLAGYGILVYKHLFQELQKDWYTVHFTAPVKTVTVSWFLLSCLCIWGVCMSRAHTSPWVHTPPHGCTHCMWKADETAEDPPLEPSASFLGGTFCRSWSLVFLDRLAATATRVLWSRLS